MNKIVIYLAGGIRKKFIQEDKKILIDEDIKESIFKELKEYDVFLLDPNISKALGNTDARFGKDMLQVSLSNFLIIDLREKRGIGVGAEMMFAKAKQIPVISICPSESHYKRTTDNNQEWIHPFVSALSDVVVNNFSEATKWILNFIKNPTETKSLADVEEYINFYKKEYMNDDPKFFEKYKNISKK